MAMLDGNKVLSDFENLEASAISPTNQFN